MGLFERYLFRQATGALVLILVSLTSVVWIVTALKQLSLLTTSGQTSFTFMQMTLLAIPNLLTIIMPVALLITTVFTLNKSNGDSELIVMTASGAQVWKFAKPLLLLGVMVAAWVAVANFLVNPWSVRKLDTFIAKVRTDLISQVLQPGQFSSPEKGLTFHIRKREDNGDLSGLMMHDARDPKLQVTYLAQRGEIVKQDGKAYLVMHIGQILRTTEQSKGSQIINFTKNIIDLSRFDSTSTGLSLKPRARYLNELLNPDENDPRYKHNPGKFRSVLHERFASVLYPIAFVLIAVAQLGTAQTNRQSRTRNIVSAFVIAALFRLGGLAATHLATLHVWAVILVYLLPLGAIGFAVFLAQSKMTPKRRSVITEKFVFWFEGAMTNLQRILPGGTNRQSEGRAT